MNNKNIFLLLIILIKSPCIAQQEPFKPLRINGIITLDGKLNEPEWRQAPIEGDFMQTDPKPGSEPTEKTEVRILYNNEYMYVGVHAYDSFPSKLIQVSLDRDFSLGSDDATSFMLDTYHDKSSGVIFASNTLGARWDEQVSYDGLNENTSYNTFWDVASHIDSSGYTTEYRIPFSSLRFKAKKEVTMGIRVSRLVKRKMELTTCPKFDPNVQNGWLNVSLARDIIFNDLKGHKPFYITPYIIANYIEENVLNDQESAYSKNSEFIGRKHFISNNGLDKLISNVGLDAKYGLSKNFTLDFTLNTDFAQAEVDDRIINLSKYEVNLPEKRNFFLESSGNLDYSFPSGNELFTSRNIGNEKDLIVPIIAGLRVTGKSNGWQLGILNMQTMGIAEDSISPHNFLALRTRKDIDGKGSFIGAMLTNRINTDTSNLTTQAFSLDFIKKINSFVVLKCGVAGSSLNAKLKPLSNSMYYYAGINKNTNEGTSYSTVVELIKKDFDPAIGYLDENNYGLASGSLGYQLKASENSKAEYWYIKNIHSYRWKLSSGNRETFSANLIPGVGFKNGADINISLFEYKIDSLLEDWKLDNQNAISSSTYKMFSNVINFTSPQQSVYTGNFSVSYGSFYGGKRLFITPSGGYSFNCHFHADLTYEYNHINFKKYFQENRETVFRSNLLRISLAYLMSVTFSIKIYTQYDDLSHQVSSNLRIRYNPNEGTDLFIVFNQGLNTQRNRLDPHLPFINTQAVTIKFSKTFGI